MLFNDDILIIHDILFELLLSSCDIRNLLSEMTSSVSATILYTFLISPTLAVLSGPLLALTKLAVLGKDNHVEAHMYVIIPNLQIHYE
jgi:hypothetical protein